MESSRPGSLRERRQAIVQRHIDAENGGDVDAVVALFHRPRYEIRPMGVVSDGAAAVRELVSGLFAGFPDFRFTLSVVHHADDAVIIEGSMTGTHRAPWAGLVPRGGRLDVPVACIFEFDEDWLVNEKVFFDFATVQRQLAG